MDELYSCRSVPTPRVVFIWPSSAPCRGRVLGELQSFQPSHSRVEWGSSMPGPGCTETPTGPGWSQDWHLWTPRPALFFSLLHSLVSPQDALRALDSARHCLAGPCGCWQGTCTVRAELAQGMPTFPAVPPAPGAPDPCSWLQRAGEALAGAGWLPVQGSSCRRPALPPHAANCLVCHTVKDWSRAVSPHCPSHTPPTTATASSTLGQATSPCGTAGLHLRGREVAPVPAQVVDGAGNMHTRKC